jgi:DNA-binding NarL/FixJ family response regulator
MSITILIVDDHEVVRQGLRALLSDAPEFQVVAEAADGEDALRQASHFSPDIAIVDLSLPGMTGLSLVSTITAQSPTMRVVVLSMHSDEAYVAESFRLGASGYIVKGAPSAEILRGLHVVADGQNYVSEGIPSRLILNSDGLGKAQNPYSRLTAREIEVLNLVAEGLTSKAIGERLGIASRTVESHRAHISRKLDLKSSQDLLAYAMRHDLLTRRQ